MENRGGIKDLFLKDKTKDIPNYYQLEGHFDTVTPGCKLYNSILEAWSEVLVHSIQEDSSLKSHPEMRSHYVHSLNYTDCRVRAEFAQ